MHAEIWRSRHAGDWSKTVWRTRQHPGNSQWSADELEVWMMIKTVEIMAYPAANHLSGLSKKEIEDQWARKFHGLVVGTPALADTSVPQTSTAPGRVK